MINPYEEEMIRRRLQQQPDANQPQFQQPAPMTNLPLYSGPELPQWTPMGDGGQGQDMNNAGAGMASLLKRFRKPGIVETPHVGGSVGHVGTSGGIGLIGHGY